MCKMSRSIASYFKAKSDEDSSVPFKSSLPPNVVRSALKEIKKVSEEKNGHKRGSYTVFSYRDKAKKQNMHLKMESQLR